MFSLEVLADLVAGELMQLQQKTDEEDGERFQNYLDKSFNKTASLMAYSCKVGSCTNLMGMEISFRNCIHLLQGTYKH
jgi:geranylgeranyl pyrophosphate synthase